MEDCVVRESAIDTDRFAVGNGKGKEHKSKI